MKITFLLFLSLLSYSLFSQEKQASSYEVACVGFYNVENLFDTINTPDVNDEDFTPTGRNAWSSERYIQKLDRLAEVIAMLGSDYTPDGPAILGLCEVENRAVVYDLIQQVRLKNKDYQIVHYDSPDKRGIDVALLYQPKYFKVESSSTHTLKIPGKDNFYTRDMLLVSGLFMGERTHFMVAHWPSRSGGEKRSSPYRQAAGLLAKSIIDSISNAEGDSAKVIFMGDLNDDPVNKSVRVNMNSKGSVKKVVAGSMFNPFEELYKKGIGTLAWQDAWNLFDQIIMTPAFVQNKSGFHFYKAVVFNKPFLMQKEGRFKGYPWRSFAGGSYLEGYSDHFPTYVLLKRKLQN
jgi:hypothetical protein